jgi:transcriptional regulator with XRE-family HTH domain
VQELRRIRKERGLTQRELADASGVDPATISLVETGKRRPHLETLDSLADALGVEVGSFFPQNQASLFEVLVGDEWQQRPPPNEAYFVPLEEGEEEDHVTLRFYYAPLLEGDEPVLLAIRAASPEEEARMRQEIEKSERTRE